MDELEAHGTASHRYSSLIDSLGDASRRHLSTFSGRLRPCRAARVKTLIACSTPGGHARTWAPTASAVRAVLLADCWTPSEHPCGKEARGTSPIWILVGVLESSSTNWPGTGPVQTTAVDASRPYLDLLRQAAAERGYDARHRRIEGDFTPVADSVEPATIVTLDKVICCYPDMITLVRASPRKATVLYGIVIPRDAAWVRATVGLVNWFVRRVLRWQFRAFAHSHRKIDRLCAEEGLDLDRDDSGLFWCVRLYRRAAA